MRNFLCFCGTRAHGGIRFLDKEVDRVVVVVGRVEEQGEYDDG